MQKCKTTSLFSFWVWMKSPLYQIRLILALHLPKGWWCFTGIYLTTRCNNAVMVHVFIEPAKHSALHPVALIRTCAPHKACSYKEKRHICLSPEREGFEPPGLLTQLFSRQPQSTTLPSLHNHYTILHISWEEIYPNWLSLLQFQQVSFSYDGVSNAVPINGRSTFGTTTEPSACW